MMNNTETLAEVANRIEDDLWIIASEHYGLGRTEESAHQLSDCLDNLIFASAREHGITVSEAHEISYSPPVGMAGLALSLSMADLAAQKRSAAYLAIASEGLGILRALKADANIPIAPAAALAHLRHEKTRATTKVVEDFWRRNIDHALSAQKAAEILYDESIGFGFKKNAEIVSRLRKKEVLRKK